MASTKTIFQLATKPTFLENIAVRPGGTILTTRIDAPELWEIDPVTGHGKVLLSIPGVTSISGITELSPDVFAVGVGEYSLQTGAVPGSWGVWTIDLTGGEPKASLAAKAPEMGLLNGVATWDEETIVAADSPTGKIFKINLKDGTSSVCLQDESMKPAVDAFMPIGVNGVKVLQKKYIYFTSSTRQIFARVPVDAEITATGPVEVLASEIFGDDFALTEDGTAYVTAHPTNMVVRVSPGGEVVVLAGSPTSFDVAGATACAFGRGEKDKNVLYVSTSGASAVPIAGEFEPAKVVAVTLKG